MEEKRKVIRVSRKKLVYGLVIAVIVIVLLVLGRGFSSRKLNINQSAGPAMDSFSSNSGRSLDAPMMERMPAPYPNYGNDSSIKDTREFLKTNYSAQMRTRDVSETIDKAESAIHEVDGRIDNISSSEKNGYISFVIPKSRFYEFKDTIEKLTHKKLYTENISSQNLLSQKQGIEGQMDSASQYLAQLEASKKSMDAVHASKLGAIQQELTSVQSQLVSIRQTIAIAQDETQLSQLRSQESVLMQREITLKQNRDQENKTYTLNNQSIQAQITQAKNNISNVQDQDVQFTDNVETVNGSISVRWICLWDLAKTFSPIHPTIIVIVLVIVLWYFARRKGYLPEFELV